MQTQLVKKSSNSKVGPIPISNTERDSCPPSCPMIKGPCYAEMGFHTKLNWNKLDTKERGTSFTRFCGEIQKLKPGQLWRHNVSGDLVGKGDVINAAALRLLTTVNSGLKGFTYTHYPLTKPNLKAITAANDGGFTVNLSANTLDQAREYLQTGLPVVTVLPIEYERTSDKSGWTESLAAYKARIAKLDSEGLIVCPATSRDNVSCATCKLCQVGNRGSIVGFPAHGSGKKKANIIARG